MSFTAEQLAKAKAAKSVEKLSEIAKEFGTDLTGDEAKRLFEQWHKEGELSDDELDNVAGGGCGSLDISSNDPHCPECGAALKYLTLKFENDEKTCAMINGRDIFECTGCGKHYLRYWDGDEWTEDC